MRATLWHGIASLLISSYLAAAPQQSSTGRIAQLSKGSTSGDSYANPDLGFRYQLPSGWSVNERETTAVHQFAWMDDPGTKTQTQSPSACSKTLLFVTKHPEGMKLNSFDPLALMVAIDPACFPEIVFPKSATERDAIQKAAGQILGHLQTPGSAVRGPARVRAFDNAGRVMLEISRPLSITTREVALGSLTTVRNINRSVLAMSASGYWVLWIFVTGDDVDMDYLKATKIFLDPPGDSPAKK